MPGATGDSQSSAGLRPRPFGSRSSCLERPATPKSMPGPARSRPATGTSCRRAVVPCRVPEGGLSSPLAAGSVISLTAGWSSLVARRAHNPKVVGSNPTPATNLRVKAQVRDLGLHRCRAGVTGDVDRLPNDRGVDLGLCDGSAGRRLPARGTDKVRELVRCGRTHAWEQVLVGVHRERWVGMTESFRHDLDGDAICDEERRVSVVRTVEADAREIVSLHDAIEELRDRLWVEGSGAGCRRWRMFPAFHRPPATSRIRSRMRKDGREPSLRRQ